jgi:hypothetical protein
MERAFSEALATEGTEFTERFALSPSTRQPLLQPGCVEMGKNVRLCVLGDLCGRTFLTSGRPKRSMAKQDRGRLGRTTAENVEGAGSSTSRSRSRGRRGLLNRYILKIPRKMLEAEHGTDHP